MLIVLQDVVLTSFNIPDWYKVQTILTNGWYEYATLVIKHYNQHVHTTNYNLPVQSMGNINTQNTNLKEVSPIVKHG